MVWTRAIGFLSALVLMTLLGSLSQASPWTCKFLLVQSSHIETMKKINHATKLKQHLPKKWNNEVTQFFSRFGSTYEPIVQILADKSLYVEWVVNLRFEILKRMKSDGLPSLFIRDNSIMRKYLDDIVAERALAFGFKLNSRNRPFNHLSTNQDAFFKRIYNGELFYDFGGVLFFAPHLFEGIIFHGKRSHAMQALFLAEYIPDFVNIYRNIGRTQDQLVWSYLFDLPSANGITNNALFMKYLNLFLLHGTFI